MVTYDSVTAPFLIMGTIAGLLLVGVILRRTVPFMRKSLLPASIIAGLLGFILINADVIPIDRKVFETLSFHLLNLSFVSISYTSTAQKNACGHLGRKKDSVALGGLWMAFMWGTMISVQIVVSGLISWPISLANDGYFNPLYGVMSAHGFAQGPVQALSVAMSWASSVSDNSLSDIIQIGLFYSVMGYLSAILVGVPLCNWLFKKNLATNERGKFDRELDNGIYENNSGPELGRQVTHRANIDTLTFQIALMLATYAVAFLLVSFIDPEHNTVFYNMIFVPSILLSKIVIFVLRKLKADYLVNSGVQTSITNFCTDTALVACMLSVSIGVIAKYMFPLFAVSIVVVAVTVLLTWFLAKRSGKYAAERFITVFGNATGTALTGLLLLRILDSQLHT